MPTPQSLDPLADSSFVPLRNAEGRIVLLDTHGPRAGGSDNQARGAVALRRRLSVRFRGATIAAARITDETRYRAWYAEHGEPAFVAASEARETFGACVGDEGSEWCALADRLLSTAHRPGWRCVPRGEGEA